MFRLIIAEDEAETCENMVECIDWGEYGFEIVGVANDGGAAYEMIYEKAPDIVLIDIRMPVMSGLEVIRRVRAENVLFPVFIIISGYDTFTYAQEALHLRVDSYLLKPFNPDQLLIKLQEAISRTSFVGALTEGGAAETSAGRSLSHELTDSGCIRYPYALEQPLINCLASGDAARLKRLADGFLDAAYRDNPSTNKFYHCFLILYAEICRLLTKNNCSIKRLRSLEGWTPATADSAIRGALHETAESAMEALCENNVSSQIIRQVKDYLEKRYMEKLTLNDIADHVHITPGYLSSLFSKQMGIPLTGYIQQLRVEAAKVYLRNLDYSLTDIACKVGYPDMKYFSEVFKRVTGVSPNTFRNRIID